MAKCRDAAHLERSDSLSSSSVFTRRAYTRSTLARCVIGNGVIPQRRRPFFRETKEEPRENDTVGITRPLKSELDIIRLCVGENTSLYNYLNTI